MHHVFEPNLVFGQGFLSEGLFAAAEEKSARIALSCHEVASRQECSIRADFFHAVAEPLSPKVLRWSQRRL